MKQKKTSADTEACRVYLLEVSIQRSAVSGQGSAVSRLIALRASPQVRKSASQK
ncbi:MAG: hypothetical protein F6K44_13375 [Moorea sp. SIO3E2]|uniref:hypothetical protein n=1 Tax=Moorena sp. SIO4E2 TaxID=2607826 RepID=UPI0013B7111A|nr:hypothetical protein [Moorena sp. SIO4E2]NEQ09134.1 hypothetical protein [Moorena sp. SIO4E2]NEQ14779.1 hypothetical protein [Moorena sp. SIO3E2]